MGAMIRILGGTYTDSFGPAYSELVKQLKDGKKKTWRESKADELGPDICNLPKVTK